MRFEFTDVCIDANTNTAPTTRAMAFEGVSSEKRGEVKAVRGVSVGELQSRLFQETQACFQFINLDVFVGLVGSADTAWSKYNR